MPYVAQVAVGRREKLAVFGNDYDTPDGTGVRDYIHVCDLAEGHVAALRYLLDAPRSITVNLGTGQGYSVLDLVRAYEAAAAAPCPMRSWPAAPATWPPAGPTPALPPSSSAGAPFTAWPACARQLALADQQPKGFEE